MLNVEMLVERARQAKQHAYSPYSNFPVGAAILMADGTVFEGVNVENVSFGATNCAERSAFFTAISAGYRPKSVKAIAIAGDTTAYLPPCSICRQVMVELCDFDTPVYLTRQDESIYQTTVGELVPYSFETLEM